MRFLGLDIGRRRTGAAFVDDSIGVPLALDTFQHTSIEEAVGMILQACDEREIDLIVIGLPLLPSGKEGSQSVFVRTCGDALEAAGMTVEYLDERYTTSKDTSIDGDAKAACDLLLMFLDRQR